MTPIFKNLFGVTAIVTLSKIIFKTTIIKCLYSQTYVKTPKKFSKRTVEPVNAFSKVTGYRVNIRV